MTAPLVLFTYNRLEKTKSVLRSLEKNDLAGETDLYVFCDSTVQRNEKNKEVKEYLRNYVSSVFKSVHVTIAEEHKGLVRSVISGVSDVLNKHGTVIVNEDDLVCNPNYLTFMNEALTKFKKTPKVWSIGGWAPECSGGNDSLTYTHRGCSWGWATWKNRWDTTDRSIQDRKLSVLEQYRIQKAGPDLLLMLKNQREGKIDSWAVRWVCSQAIQKNRRTSYHVHDE